MTKRVTTTAGSSAHTPPVATPLEALVARLNQYKELIAIAAFFVGGFLWVFGYFVTKSQFAELKCFAKSNIVVNRETMKLRDAEAAIAESSRRLDDLEDKRKSGELSDKEKGERKRLDTQVETLKDEIKVARVKLNAAKTKLEDSDCLGAEEK